jgi:hypothetical protein
VEGKKTRKIKGITAAAAPQKIMVQPEYITYDIETVTLTDNQTDALDPLKGQLVCVGFKEWNKGVTQIFCEENENAVLQQAWSYIISKIPATIFMGFNISFDWEWLVKKGLKHCPEKVHKAQYFNVPQADIRLVLSNGDKFKKGTLKDYCDFFGIPVKQLGHGEEVTGWFRNKEFDKIKAYNAEDLLAEEKLAELVLNLKKVQNDNSDKPQLQEKQA